MSISNTSSKKPAKQLAFILIGRSGCGKGTQAKLLIERLNQLETEAGLDARKVLYVQNGAEFRDFIKGDSAVAKLSAKAYAAGILQPEFLAVHMWTTGLVREYHGTEHMILDGMPRKQHEAGVLDSMFDFVGIEKPFVINIDVSKEWATEHLLARHRADDTRGDVESRMKWYEADVVPAIEYYRNNPKYRFLKVNGERPAEDIFAEIVEQAGL